MHEQARGELVIAYVSGTVAAKDASGAIIEAGGIGYELAMSTKALSGLPAVGAAARVWTYLQVKDDGFALFGFADVREKQLFCRLINVSGVGAKTALAALSTFDAGSLAAVIAEGDVAALSRVPGIGKKTAQRMVLELQGILKADQPAALPLEQNTALTDAADALQAMGFTADEVARALKDVGTAGKTAGDIVRAALRNMGGTA